MTPDRLPLVMFLFLGLVVCAVIGLATASWWWFAVAAAVHLIGSTIVLTGAFRNARAGDAADPESRRLDRKAAEAVGDRPRNVETELEALKRE
jgi:membrane protein implicated in regulation of membrane protease activity